MRNSKQEQEPFILMPLRDNFKNNQTIPINYIKLWPAIAVHANSKEKYKAYPTIKRLAALSSLRESEVKQTLLNFAEAGAITIHSQDNEKLIYTLEMPRIKKEDSFPIGSSLILSGLWAGLPDSRKLLYCSFLAFSENPIFYFEADRFLIQDKIIACNNVRFLSKHGYQSATSYFFNNFGDKTFKRSADELLRKKFLLFGDNDKIFLPYHVEGKNQEVLNKLERLKEKNITRRAKLSLRALSKRAGHTGELNDICTGQNIQ